MLIVVLASVGVPPDAIGQRDHRADTGDCHQAPTYIIVPDVREGKRAISRPSVGQS